MTVTENLSFSEELGSWLKRLRSRKGISQSELAERLGRTPSAMSQIENGDYEISVRNLFEILDELGYEGSLEVNPSDDAHRTTWGSVNTDNPEHRERVVNARSAAEKSTRYLYENFDIDAVYVFGSLVNYQGELFFESSDIDLAIEGVDDADIAEMNLELDEFLVEKGITDHRVELHSVGNLPRSLGQLQTHYLPSEELDV
jgi:transcriptional regulator with XRE-family HTH domain